MEHRPKGQTESYSLEMWAGFKAAKQVSLRTTKVTFTWQ